MPAHYREVPLMMRETLCMIHLSPSTAEAVIRTKPAVAAELARREGGIAACTPEMAAQGAAMYRQSEARRNAENMETAGKVLDAVVVIGTIGLAAQALTPPPPRPAVCNTTCNARGTACNTTCW